MASLLAQVAAAETETETAPLQVLATATGYPYVVATRSTLARAALFTVGEKAVKDAAGKKTGTAVKYSAANRLTCIAEAMAVSGWTDPDGNAVEVF